MNGTRSATAARRGGSSFGPGPRRGTDPEGGERSAWKGLAGPSGLNLDHSRIPHIQQQVYDALTPLVVAVHDPIPLSKFTQKCCDVLLPVLERQQELGPHEFKSQWGRLNEFVCPELARRAGVGDSGYSREHKTVKIDLSVPSSSSTPAGRTAGAAGSSSSAGGTPPGFPAPRPSPAAAAAPAQGVSAAGQLPMTIPIPVQVNAGHAVAPSGSVGVPLAASTVAGLAVMPPAPCAYCHGPHCMKHCPDFHAMLQSVYQAGYQQGLAAAQQMAQTAPSPSPPPS